MMGNYHVGFGEQSMVNTLTATHDFYRSIRFYCMSASHGVRIYGVWEGCMFRL